MLDVDTFARKSVDRVVNEGQSSYIWCGEYKPSTSGSYGKQASR